MKKSVWLWVFLGVVILFSIYLVGSYNRFVGLDQDVNGKWSEVENQYQRQADLIPNLISVVSSAVNVETDFVKEVIEARTNYNGATTPLDKDRTGAQMTDSVVTLVNAVAENYPVLQANAQYITLTDELTGTQNRITTARGRYIESIQKYNTAIRRFPSNIFSGMFGFSSKEYYSADEDSLDTPTIGEGKLP